MSGILFGRYAAYRRSLGFMYASYRPGSISLGSSIQHQRRDKHQDRSAEDDGKWGGAPAEDRAKARLPRMRKPIEVLQNVGRKSNLTVEKPTVVSGPETSGLKTAFIECDKTSPSKVNTIPEVPMERKHESPFEFLPELPLPGQINPVEVQPKDPLKVTCQAADYSKEMKSPKAKKSRSSTHSGQGFNTIQSELSNAENDPHTMKLISEYTNFPNPLNFDLKVEDLKSSNAEVRDANFEVLKSQIEAENKLKTGEYSSSTPKASAKKLNEKSEKVFDSMAKSKVNKDNKAKKIETNFTPICEAVTELQNVVAKISESASKTTFPKRNFEEIEAKEDKKSTEVRQPNARIKALYSRMLNPESAENKTEVGKTPEPSESTSAAKVEEELYAKIETPEPFLAKTVASQAKVTQDSKPTTSKIEEPKPNLIHTESKVKDEQEKQAEIEELSGLATQSSQTTKPGAKSINSPADKSDQATADIVALFDENEDDKFRASADETHIKSNDQSKSSEELEDNYKDNDTDQFNLETVSTNFIKMRNEARIKSKKEDAEDTLYIPEESLSSESQTQDETKTDVNRKPSRQRKLKKSAPQLKDGELGVKLVSQNPEDSAPSKEAKTSLIQYLYDKFLGASKKKSNDGRRTMATFSGAPPTNDANTIKSELKKKNSKQEFKEGEAFISPSLAEQGLGAKNICKNRESYKPKKEKPKKGKSKKFSNLEDQSIKDTILCIESPSISKNDIENSKEDTLEQGQIICGSFRSKQKIRELANSNEDSGKPSLASNWQRLTRMLWMRRPTLINPNRSIGNCTNWSCHLEGRVIPRIMITTDDQYDEDLALILAINNNNKQIYEISVYYSRLNLEIPP